MITNNQKTKNHKEMSAAGTRTCLVLGQEKNRSEMIRFVLSPENIVCPDLSSKLGGRGVWITARQDILNQAIEKKLFNKAFGHSVTVPASLVDLVSEKLKKRALDFLGLARKAGLIEMGFDKIKEAAIKKDIDLLLEATDGSESEQQRLQSYLPNIPVLAFLTQKEMGFEMGRDSCVHLAIHKNRMVNGFKIEWMRACEFLKEGKEND